MKLKSKQFIGGVFAVVVLAIFAFFSLKSFAVPPKKFLLPSDYSTKVTYNQAVKMKKPIILTFYVDWCGYCRKFMPILEEMKREYSSKYTFVMVNLDLPQNKKLGEDFMISGFPTVYLVSPKNDNRVFLNQGIYGNRTVLKREFDRFLRVNK